MLFVDEIHRFNKAQQDAFLPYVERGDVVLVGATTENPYFEVIGALVSRSRVFQLRPLEDKDVRRLLERAIADPERGYGKRVIHVDEDALEHLIHVAGGDARNALNALELAVESTLPDDKGAVHITLTVAQESIQRRAVLYDKDGDAHYDTISAFIKSVRGSDPDAAMYWLMLMLEGGEDPEFIARRLVILASEDVGLADSGGIRVAVAAADALAYVGLPEATYHLAHATLYLSTAPKSNSVGRAIGAARQLVESGPTPSVPLHLRSAAYRGAAELGHGVDYDYAHDHPGGVVAQQYFPDGVAPRAVYHPGELGDESLIAERLEEIDRILHRER
jgi:putative ATPase